MNETHPKSRRPILLSMGLFGAAVGIAVAVWVSNAAQGVAQSCDVDPQRVSAIDDVAYGELAALLVGQHDRGFADLGFIDADGDQRTLADFAGKRLLVNFWATWCAPCREEMPDLDVIQARHGGEDFEVIAISLDMGSDGPAAAQDFLDDIGAHNLALFADPSYRVFERLRNEAVTMGLPATLLLDEEACELAVLQGFAHWDTPDGENVITALLRD